LSPNKVRKNALFYISIEEMVGAPVNFSKDFIYFNFFWMVHVNINVFSFIYISLDYIV